MEDLGEFQEAVRASQEISDRMDDVSGYRGRSSVDEASGPVRMRASPRTTSEPYISQVFFQFAEDEEECRQEENEAIRSKLRKEICQYKKKDYWEFDSESQTLTRHHLKRRKTRFSPYTQPPFPFKLTDLSVTRQSNIQFCGLTGKTEPEVIDEWANKLDYNEGKWWKGSTSFQVDYDRRGKEHEVELTHLVVEKKGEDTVNLKLETEESQRLWKVADKAEWDKVVGSGAVRVLTLEESRRIREELRKEGKVDRILPTKVARRYKPAELVGQPPTRKSRLCLRGDKDPDILLLDRFSPTVNTLNFNILLQVAANLKMKAAVGDFSNAFCQSQPLSRANGPLYFSPPSEGVEGIHSEQIVLIVNGMYGLVDAPLHWRRSLVEDLNGLGYYASKLDPCIFKWHDEKSGALKGAIAVEVDDLFMIGGEEHYLQMKKLRGKYKFGKWVELMEETDGCSFNGRRVRQTADYGFLIDMEKFIEERLQPIPIAKGRASCRKESATAEEVHLARAACGALNWLSKEGRPDAAGPSSLMASRITRLKVEDLYSINDVIKVMKQNAKVSVMIQPLDQMKLGVVTDASYANDGFHSQGGHVIIAHEPQLSSGGSARANVLSWRSGKLQSVVNSTLAAETQSLSRGLGDLLWTMITMEEFVNGKFQPRKWPVHLSAADALVMASEKSGETLKEALTVVDAKSLFDHLSKDGVGGQDKRTAVEIQIIREDLNSLSGSIRWVDHKAMIADGPTKIKGSNEALYRLLQSGRFSLKEEGRNLEDRKNARADGTTNAEIRRSGIKENVGNVKQMSRCFHSMLS